MSGNQNALDQMVEAMVTDGRIALLGILPGKSAANWVRIIFKTITPKGIYGREKFSTWHKMIAMLQNGLDVSGTTTHRYPMPEFEDGFSAMKSGQSGKAVLYWRAA
jgi:threonine 3-dehydrogenase